MTTTKFHNSPRDPEALQTRFALAVTARLSEQAEEKTSHDIGERLRFARERALERAREVRREAALQAAPAVHHVGGRSAALGGGSSWWLKLASVMPLVMLVVGLNVIERLHDRNQIVAAAEVDSALLADNLPPDAYRDPGFLEFLKTAQD